jgi:hypothetical protein
VGVGIDNHVNSSSGTMRLISIQLFDEAAVLDFFQDRRIDEVIGVQIFHFWPGLGELIDDGLNTIAVRDRSTVERPPSVRP